MLIKIFYYIPDHVPEAPSNVSLQKDSNISGSYIIHWQSSSSSASIDNYTITSSQTFTTTATSLSLSLPNNVNSTISVKATNCVGSSMETVWNTFDSK